MKGVAASLDEASAGKERRVTNSKKVITTSLIVMRHTVLYQTAEKIGLKIKQNF